MEKDEQGSIITPLNRCPRCFYTMDRCVSPMGDFKPKDGDISLCIKCGAVMAFTSTGTIRPFKESEFREIMKNEPVMSLITSAVKAIYFIRENDPKIRMS